VAPNPRPSCTGRYRPRTLAVPLALALAAPGAGAQAVLAGRVVSEPGDRPVADAEIAVPAVNRSTRTDSAGGFELRDIPAGRYEVVVRSPGFRALRVPGQFAPGQRIEADLVLERAPQALPEVTVTRPAAPVVPRLVGFERRRADGEGVFITRAQLERREHSKLSDVLRSASGVRFIYRDRGGIALANNRYAGTLPGQKAPPQCYMQIFLDGVRVFEPSQLGSPGMEPPDVNQYTIAGIEGIEVYRGPAETPPEFGGTNAMCGTLVIWTRGG
jgi:hypothetical protein